MKLAAIAICCVWISSAAFAETPPATADRLAWLAGCWEYAGAEPGSGEAWLAPAGGELHGVGRSVEGGRVVSYEFMRILPGENGSLVFAVSASGAPERRFMLASITAAEVVFEDPTNDFPQRVIYRLAQDGEISARIEGAKDDPSRARDFAMKRCKSPRRRRAATTQAGANGVTRRRARPGRSRGRRRRARRSHSRPARSPPRRGGAGSG
jgi:hypothetical protein